MIVLRNASTPPLELLCHISPSLYSPIQNFRITSHHNDWIIKDWHNSPSALLFHVGHDSMDEGLVIKMLRDYQDTRYSLETLEKRQQCLLEALQRNRVFTPELYLGLAPLYHLDLIQGTIHIGEVMEYPTQKLLDVDTEYVLLMKPQEQETRLDYLLARREFANLIPLVEFIADIHNYKVFDLSDDDSSSWGNYTYLMQKMEHNLELLDFLVNRCNESDWDDRIELAQSAIRVKNTFQEMAMQECYHQYFQLRVSGGYIKLCHGDIKSPHIWIASDGSTGKQPWTFNLLDAIDFNNMYNHIDILSDFAMLLADVQARTQSSSLIDEMVDSYLQKTNQDNEVARRVLDFYMMDKAIVGTGISILYDEEPLLGRAFLKVAENRLESICAVGARV
jgi:aminoglycoside phosphotransferase family enzyme